MSTDEEKKAPTQNASESDADDQFAAAAPPPRPDLELGDEQDDCDREQRDQDQRQHHDQEQGQQSNDNVGGEDAGTQQDQDQEQEQEQDQQLEETSAATTAHNPSTAASASTPAPSLPVVYSVQQMLELRLAMKKNPLLSSEFQSFMKGIAVAIEGNVTTTTTTAAGSGGVSSPFLGAGGNGAAAIVVGGANKDFFGRSAGVGSASASGGGTPFSPHLGVGGKEPMKFKDLNSKDLVGGKSVLGGGGGASAFGAGEFSRDALFGEVKIAQNAIKERTLLHKVRGIFAKVSHDNFKAMTQELCALPIRQSDDKEVREVVHWMYDKAVQPEDEIYVELYANLIKELTNDIQGKDPKKASALRKALVEKCQQSFDKRSDVVKSTADEISNAANAETTIETRDSAASAALKVAIAQDDDPEYVKNRERSRLRANIKFLAQLCRVNMVTSKVVNYVLYSLLYGSNTESGRRHKPEEYEIEMFCDLIKNTQQLLPPDIREQYLPKYLDTVKEYSKNPKTSMRVRCLLSDLVEISENGWMSRDERRKKGLLVTPSVAVPGPMTPASPFPAPVNSYVPPGQRMPHNINIHGGGGGGAGAMAGINIGNSNISNTNNSNMNDYSSTPTPPYSPVVAGPPPTYPGRAGGGGGRGGGGGGRGVGSPNIAIPVPLQQQQLQLQLQQHHQHQQQLPPPPPNADKDTFIAVVEKFKKKEIEKKDILEHFQMLNGQLRYDHLCHWFGKCFKLVRKADDRRLASEILQLLIENKLCRHTIGYDVLSQLAPQVVLEIEDNPRIFECWADFMQRAFPTVIPVATNCILLRELVRDDNVEFATIEKMLSDVSAAIQPYMKEFVSGGPNVDVALHRFRLLPIVLSCTRESDESLDESGGGGGSSSGSMMMTSGGGDSSMMMNNSASGANANDDDSTGVAPLPIPVRKDLLAYLLTHPQRPRADTAVASEIELDIFGILTNFDNNSQVNLQAAMKRAKSHPQRSDPCFYAGFFCALFCYLRLALVTGERTDFDKIRELMTVLKVPGDNTQLFIRECFMTYCEFGGVPVNAFQAMIEIFVPGRDSRESQNDTKTFNDWKMKNQLAIQGIVGRHHLPKARSNNANY